MLESLRVVLDTNVLVSAFIGGVPREVLRTWRNRQCVLCLSEEIMVEYRRVLSRFERLREDADALLEMIGTGEHVLFVTPVERLHLISSDPSDDKFLECALAAEAALIISGDRHLLALGEFRGLSILDPAQALPLLTAGENPSPAE